MDPVPPSPEALRSSYCLVLVRFGCNVPGACVRINDTCRSRTDAVCNIIAALEVGGNKEWDLELPIGNNVTSNCIENVGIVLLRDNINILFSAIGSEDERLCINFCRKMRNKNLLVFNIVELRCQLTLRKPVPISH